MKKPKGVWLWVVAALLVYVGWRWWQSHQSSTQGSGGSSLRAHQGSRFTVPNPTGRNRRRG